jgi:hypothetical protein
MEACITAKYKIGQEKKQTQEGNKRFEIELAIQLIDELWQLVLA